MAFLSRLWAWLRRLGASRPDGPAAGPARRIGDLLAAGPALAVVSAHIHDHVAVINVRDPLPGALDDAAEAAVFEEAWRGLREHPAEGPILAMEVWAPPAPGAPRRVVMRRELKRPLTVSPAPSPEVLRAQRERRVPHVPTAEEDTPHAGVPAPRGDPIPVAAQPLRPLGQFLALPEPLAGRLRARGVDPSGPDLAGLVEGLLAEAGYSVRRAEQRGRTVELEASSGAARAMVRCYPSEGEVAPATVDRFAFAFLSSRADEGFFVTDGLLPFDVRHWERDPRIHLLDRVGLQRLVDAVAASAAGPTA